MFLHEHDEEKVVKTAVSLHPSHFLGKTVQSNDSYHQKTHVHKLHHRFGNQFIQTLARRPQITRHNQVVQRLLVDLAPEENLGQNYVAGGRPFKDDQLIETDEGNHTHEHQAPAPKKWNFISSARANEIEKNIQVLIDKVDYSNVNINEPVIFAGHGISSKGTIKETEITTSQAQALQGYTAKEIAKSLIKGLPKDYQGMIFLHGCYTASGLQINFDNSMAMQLVTLLKDKFPLVTVKGNVGASHSTGDMRGHLFFNSYSGKEAEAASVQIEMYQKLYAEYFELLEKLQKDFDTITQKEPLFENHEALISARAALQENEAKMSDLMLANTSAIFKKIKKTDDDQSSQSQYEAKKAFLDKNKRELEATIDVHTAEEISFKEKSAEYREWQLLKQHVERHLNFLKKIQEEAKAGRLTFGFEAQFNLLKEL